MGQANSRKDVTFKTAAQSVLERRSCREPYPIRWHVLAAPGPSIIFFSIPVIDIYNFYFQKSSLESNTSVFLHVPQARNAIVGQATEFKWEYRLSDADSKDIKTLQLSRISNLKTKQLVLWKTRNNVNITNLKYAKRLLATKNKMRNSRTLSYSFKLLNVTFDDEGNYTFKVEFGNQLRNVKKGVFLDVQGTAVCINCVIYQEECGHAQLREISYYLCSCYVTFDGKNNHFWYVGLTFWSSIYLISCRFRGGCTKDKSKATLIKQLKEVLHNVSQATVLLKILKRYSCLYCFHR